MRSRERFEWLEGGYFLVQLYETVFGEEPPQIGVNYWRFDTDDRRFRIVFFSNNGPYTPEGNTYEGIATDETLTFEGPARFRYRLGDDGAVLIDDDGSLSIDWWLRDRAGRWQPWMTNSFTRADG